jgi:hypothetical protein
MSKSSAIPTRRTLIAKTISAVTQCIARGSKRPQVALITYRGRENSKLAPYDKLRPYPLRAPTGRYDLLGNGIFTDGDLLIDSVQVVQGAGVTLRGIHRDRFRATG